MDNSFEKAEFCLKLASTEEEKMNAYLLRYKAYLSTNSIPPNEDKIFVDSFDHQENIFTYTLGKDDQMIGSIRVNIYSKKFDFDQIPSRTIFETEINEHIPSDSTIIESNRFVIDPEYSGSVLEAQIKLFSMNMENISKYNADYFIAAVRKNHVGFYKRFMLLSVISDEKIYPGTNIPMILMIGHVDSKFKKVCKRTPLICMNEEEKKRYAMC